MNRTRPGTEGCMIRRMSSAALAAAAMLLLAVAAQAQPAGKMDPDGLTADQLRRLMPEYFHLGGGGGRSGALDVPDVFGPGAVLDVGNIYMKVSNAGHCGNFFT